MSKEAVLVSSAFSSLVSKARQKALNVLSDLGTSEYADMHLCLPPHTCHSIICTCLHMHVHKHAHTASSRMLFYNHLQLHMLQRS